MSAVCAISRYCTVVRVIAVSAQMGACIRPNNLSNHLATSNNQHYITYLIEFE